MGNTTKANVLLIAPELAVVTDDLFNLVLADVALDITSGIYGARQERAQRYLVAHVLTLSGVISTSSKIAGPTTAEKVGDVSTSSWALNLRDTNRYDETIYGRTFNLIRKSCIVKFRHIGPS